MLSTVLASQNKLDTSGGSPDLSMLLEGSREKSLCAGVLHRLAKEGQEIKRTSGNIGSRGSFLSAEQRAKEGQEDSETWKLVARVPSRSGDRLQERNLLAFSPRCARKRGMLVRSVP